MKIVSFKGGLGNQIFEYLFYLYLKENSNSKIYGYYNKEWLSGHNGLEIENVFDVELPKAAYLSDFVVFIVRSLNKIFKTKSLISSDNKVELNSIYFDGWWQNQKYYKNSPNFIKFKEVQLDNKNSNILESILQTESISIHVRRGDYLESRFNKKYGNICTLDYYKKAMALTKDGFTNPTFYVFSDDVEWTIKNLPIKNSIFISNNTGSNSFIDMYLMSHCKANIIANSSFSYWGAYLNKANSKVIYPKKWFNSNDAPPDIFKSDWFGV